MMKLNPNKTEKKSWTKIDKKGREEVWEWEITPEARDAIKKLLTLTLKIVGKRQLNCQGTPPINR